MKQTLRNQRNNRADDRGDKLALIGFAMLGGILGALLANMFLFCVIRR